MTKFYFSHARTAFKFGMSGLGMQNGDEILIPSYICSVLIPSILQLGIKVKYYSLNKDFTPEWTSLDKLITQKTKAILMVHYFGQPQNITEFKNFCRKHSIFLIEDNAHGLGGRFEGKLLGVNGDIGISSPRKFFNIYSGGILYWNRIDRALPSISDLPVYKVTIRQRVFKLLSRHLPVAKTYLKTRFLNRPSFEDPYSFQEPVVEDTIMDEISKAEYCGIDWEKAKLDKQQAYSAWSVFSEKNDLEPVFSNFYYDASPQCYPVYVKDTYIATKLFDWGWKHGFHVYSWPSLPDEIIRSRNEALDRWRHLVCFSTNISSEQQSKIKKMERILL